MRKLLGIMLVCALIMFGFLQIRQLPVQRKNLIEAKYAGFSGVLRAWFCADFSCEKSLIGWLNRCAAEFEQDHPGVYIEVESVTAKMINELSTVTLPPDMVFFSPGMINEGQVRGETVVAMGGYAGIAQTGTEFSLTDCVLPSDSRRDYAAAAICIGENTAEREDEIFDPGLTILNDSADDILAAFVRGEIACTVVTTGQLAKLIEKRDRGIIDGWSLTAGDTAFTDQLLVGASTGDGDRADLARAFIQSLTEEENQMALADYGALSPITRIYADAGDYAAIDTACADGQRILKKIYDFGEHDSTAILEDYRSGKADIMEARQRVAEMYGNSAIYK